MFVLAFMVFVTLGLALWALLGSHAALNRSTEQQRLLRQLERQQLDLLLRVQCCERPDAVPPTTKAKEDPAPPVVTELVPSATHAAMPSAAILAAAIVQPLLLTSVPVDTVRSDSVRAAPVPVLPSAAELVSAASETAPIIDPERHHHALETFIGTRALTWVGVGILFLSAAFFLNYAYANGWLGRMPHELRIGGVMLAGALAVLWGLRQFRLNMVTLSYGVIAGGLALGYLAGVASFKPIPGLSLEPLVPQWLAFAGMSAITVIGMVIAMRCAALPIAIGALLGGLLTPLLLSNGGGEREGLFGYLLILDAGVLLAALYQRWRALDVSAFIGTAFYLLAWHVERTNGFSLGFVLWVGVFHLLFLATAFAHDWRRGSGIGVERFVMALGNVAFGLSLTALHLAANHRHELGLVTVGSALLYAALGVISRWRFRTNAMRGGSESELVTTDHSVLHGFITVAVMLLSLGLYLLLPTAAVATAWQVEAVCLLWLGYRFNHPLTRGLALALAGLGLARGMWETALAVDLLDPLLLNRWFAQLLLTLPPLVMFAVVHRWWRGRGGAGHVHGKLAAWLSGFLFLIYLSAEFLRHDFASPLTWTALPVASAIAVVWMLGAAGFLLTARWEKIVTPWLALAAAIVATIAVVAALSSDGDWGLPVANPRGIAAIGVILAWFALSWGWRRIAAIGTADPAANNAAEFPAACSNHAVGLGHAAGLGHAGTIIGHAGLAVIVASEVMTWGARLPIANAVVMVVLSAGWSLVALVAWWHWRHAAGARHEQNVAWIASAITVCAAVTALIGWSQPWTIGWPVLNPRVVTVAITIAVIAAARHWLKLRPLTSWPQLATVAGWAMGGVVFIAVTAESWSAAHDRIADKDVAIQVGTFAITASWVTMAAIGLSVGFIRRRRVLRWLALGLFALTAGKLLLVDMRDAHQIWRIIAFMITGVVLVAASYAYHRAERRLTTVVSRPARGGRPDSAIVADDTRPL